MSSIRIDLHYSHVFRPEKIFLKFFNLKQKNVMASLHIPATENEP